MRTLTRYSQGAGTSYLPHISFDRGKDQEVITYAGASIKDKVQTLFPHGVPRDIPLDTLQERLDRLDLRCRQRFPRIGKIEVYGRPITKKLLYPLPLVKERFPHSCPASLECEKHYCRSLHGKSAWEVKGEIEKRFEPFSDELLSFNCHFLEQKPHLKGHRYFSEREYRLERSIPHSFGGFCVYIVPDSNKVARQADKIGGKENLQMSNDRVRHNLIVAIRSVEGHFLDLSGVGEDELQKRALAAGYKQEAIRAARLAIPYTQNTQDWSWIIST